MKTILAIIGAVVMYCWALGTLDIIDFKLCISPPGTCSIGVRK